MTEYSLAPIMLTFLLGLTKIFLVLLAIYLPFNLFARALSFKHIFK